MNKTFTNRMMEKNNYSGTPNSVIFWSAPKMTLFRGFGTIGGFPTTQQLKSMKQVR